MGFEISVYNIEDRPTNDRPTDLPSWRAFLEELPNGHITAINHLIHFRFSSRVGLSELANLTVPFIFTPNWPRCHAIRVKMY